MTATRRPLLTIIVPVYNEERHLATLLRHLTSVPCPIDREWIVVDDSSSDGSLAVLQSLADELGLRVVAQRPNQGKGAAVRRGIQEATGDIILVQDADYEYDPRDIASLIEPILADECDVVFGSRFKKSTLQVHRTYHFFVNRFLTLLSNLFSGVYLTDMETCYKVFRADLVKAMRLRSQRFGIEVEFAAYTAKTRARVFELPIRYYPRTRLQGKKINWKDGFAALWHLVRFNFLIDEREAFDDLPQRYRAAPDHTPRSPAPLAPQADARRSDAATFRDAAHAELPNTAR